MLSNATYANNAEELVTAIRGQLKEGADFIKIYETGPDKIVDGRFSTPYQYTEEELAAQSTKPRALDIASPFMPWASPARSTQREPESRPSITRYSSATRPCA